MEQMSVAMPELLKKTIGIAVLVLSVGGTSCSAFMHSWDNDQSGTAIELSK